METSNVLIHASTGKDTLLKPEPMRADDHGSLSPAFSSTAEFGIGLGGNSLRAGGSANHCTVVLASGAEDGGKRATLALSMACTALTMEQNTLLFLVGDGSYWAYQGHADGIRIAGFPSLEELLESFVELGGNLSVCSACNHATCHITGNRDKAVTLRPEVQVQGMATVMEHLMLGRAVTF